MNQMEQLALQVDQKINNSLSLMEAQLNKQIEDFSLSMTVELEKKIKDLTNTATARFLELSNELTELKLGIETNSDEVNDVSLDINEFKYILNEFSTSFEDK